MSSNKSLTGVSSSLQKVTEASSPVFSLTSVKCNTKPMEGAGEPCVKFVVGDMGGLESSSSESTAPFSFTFSATGVSEFSVSFDLHCNLNFGSQAYSSKPDRKTDETSSMLPAETVANEEPQDSRSSTNLTKVLTSPASSKKETSTESKKSLANGTSIPSDLPSSTFASESNEEADKASNPAESCSEEESKLSAPVTVNPHITGKGFDITPVVSGCPECNAFAPAVGSPLNWRPWTPACREYSVEGHYYSDSGRDDNVQNLYQNICFLPNYRANETSQEELRLRWYMGAKHSNDLLLGVSEQRAMAPRPDIDG